MTETRGQTSDLGTSDLRLPDPLHGSNPANLAEHGESAGSRLWTLDFGRWTRFRYAQISEHTRPLPRNTRILGESACSRILATLDIWTRIQIRHGSGSRFNDATV